jgi:hypothetical protein
MKPTKLNLLLAAVLAGATITARAATVSATASSGAKPARPAEPPLAPQEPTRPSKPIPPGAESQVARAAAEVELKAAQVALDRAGFATGFAGTSSKPKRAIVVPGSNGRPADMNGLQDDLAVMYKILEKAVSPEQKRNIAMGIWVFPGRTEHSNLYIDGYGVIFFLNANYPFAAPSSDSDSDHPQAPANEWEQTKREMSEPQLSEFSYELGPVGVRSEEFKPEKVDELKTRVAYALTNATHIKELKADEYITVIVTGSSGVTARKSQFKTTRAQPKTGTPSKGPEENQLIFRVKRRDLEALESGKMTPEEFRQSVMITML